MTKSNKPQGSGRSYLSDDVREGGITEQQPAPRSDTVGFILELFRVHFIKVFEPAGTTENILLQKVNKRNRRDQKGFRGLSLHSHCLPDQF